MSLDTVSDIDLLDAIGRDDVRVAMREESNAAGWSLDTTPRAALAAEYERRYGQPLPADRSATWHYYHCPAGYIWECERSTGPDMSRADRDHHATASAVAFRRSPVAASKAAEELLVERLKYRIDSGLRSEAFQLVKVSE